MNQEQTTMIKSIQFANEFIKIVRGFAVESNRPDGLPHEIKEHLANAKLDSLLIEEHIEPEMLVWGLMQMIEMLLKFAQLTPEDLIVTMEKLIETVGNE